MSKRIQKIERRNQRFRNSVAIEQLFFRTEKLLMVTLRKKGSNAKPHPKWNLKKNVGLN
jgi:hypothetical protein